jgi:hypothetical protein
VRVSAESAERRLMRMPTFWNSIFLNPLVLFAKLRNVPRISGTIAFARKPTSPDRGTSGSRVGLRHSQHELLREVDTDTDIALAKTNYNYTFLH